MAGSSVDGRIVLEAGGRSKLRHDLALAVLAPFVIIGIVALIAVLGSDRAAGGDRALMVLIEVALALPIPMAWLARRLLANADALAAERDRLMELYGRARTDSLEDVLTGLGNHRAFQEELVRLLALADRHSGAKRAFRPVYQPIFSLADGRVIGYEGLVRPTADAPIANAGALFVAAETTDRVVELDFACLDVVAGGLGQLDPGVYLSVNLSPCTLESAQFHPADLTAIFRRHGIPLDQVVLELTERQPVKDLEQLRSNVAACRRAGMRLAADDVGAGNAGLRLFSEIQFDIVKIDLSLVQGGVDHDPSHGVIRALQELAFRWQASIVAEGVETAEQLKVVRALGLGAAQGFLLGRPSADMDVAPVLLDRLAETFDYFSRAS